MAASPEVKGAVRLKMVLQLVGLQRQLTGTDLDVGGVLYLGVFAASFNNWTQQNWRDISEKRWEIYKKQEEEVQLSLLG